jgi:hypothetical protein
VVEDPISRRRQCGSRRRSSVFILPDFHAIISLHGIDGRRPQFKNSAPGRTECQIYRKNIHASKWGVREVPLDTHKDDGFCPDLSEIQNWGAASLLAVHQMPFPAFFAAADPPSRSHIMSNNRSKEQSTQTFAQYGKYTGATIQFSL